MKDFEILKINQFYSYLCNKGIYIIGHWRRYVLRATVVYPKRKLNTRSPKHSKFNIHSLYYITKYSSIKQTSFSRKINTHQYIPQCETCLGIHSFPSHTDSISPPARVDSFPRSIFTSRKSRLANATVHFHLGKFGERGKFAGAGSPRLFSARMESFPRPENFREPAITFTPEEWQTSRDGGNETWYGSADKRMPEHLPEFLLAPVQAGHY